MRVQQITGTLPTELGTITSLRLLCVRRPSCLWTRAPSPGRGLSAAVWRPVQAARQSESKLVWWYSGDAALRAGAVDDADRHVRVPPSPTAP
jgi:hypothetical protein